MNEPTETIHAAPLPFLGVLRVGGADAAHFLQGQLTNDVQLLDDGRTQLAGYNTPQGRVIALLRLHKADDAIYALLPADLLERVCTLLRRFVLRSRVDLQVAVDLQVGWTASTSGLPSTASTHLVAFDYAPGRRVIAAPTETWRATSGLALASAQPHGLDEWLAADIRDGQPQVFAAASEAFIPQMLNLDLVGGISFSKGCYTGQEIVARTQNLGPHQATHVSLSCRWRDAASPARIAVPRGRKGRRGAGERRLGRQGRVAGRDEPGSPRSRAHARGRSIRRADGHGLHCALNGAGSEFTWPGRNWAARRCGA